jgi:hypothetical protein
MIAASPIKVNCLACDSAFAVPRTEAGRKQNIKFIVTMNSCNDSRVEVTLRLGAFEMNGIPTGLTPSEPD